MKSEKCLIGVLVLLCCTFAFSDIITGTVIDSITNVPIGQVWVGNSAGDFTYTAANGTFTLSTTTNITILKNVVQDQKDKIIQIRSIRGELLSQFTSAMLNPYLLAKGIYIVTEKEENQEPFSYKIVVISATSISNLFARANLKSNASRTLSKTRSIASTNILTFTRNGYITIHRTVTGSLSGMVVRMQIGTPDSAPDLVFPENTAMNVSTMPTLLWSSVSGATTYRIQLSTISTFANMAFDDSIVLGMSKAVSAALSNNTTNYWRVNAKNSSGTSAWSSIWGFTTIPAIPAIPVLIAPSNAASNLDAEQTLTWSTVTGATGYRVQVSTCSNFETTVSDDSTLTVGTKAIAGLEKGTMYYWRVNAMNAGGTSSWTVPWYFIVDTLIATDADGNIYHTITIGTQIWTVENLKTTKYNDGTAITLVTDSADWTNRITPGYCWYNNDSIVNKNMYGALYNWYAASVKNLAPGGWHVPTRSEWDTLRTYLLTHGYNWDGSTNGNKVSKAMAAQTIWSTYSQIGVIGNDMASNNRSGFSALPGGCRLENSDFYDIRNYSSWWSVDMPRYIYLHFDCEFFGTGTSDKRCGFSIRLVKN